MTKVIKEGNSYEFPSKDIHKTIINKLILNDSSLFKHFFQHIKTEYTSNDLENLALQCNIHDKDTKLLETLKNKETMKAFLEQYLQFHKEVELDIDKGVKLLNIEYYMRDLKKNALDEYQEVI